MSTRLVLLETVGFLRIWALRFSKNAPKPGSSTTMRVPKEISNKPSALLGKIVHLEAAQRYCENYQ